MHPPGFTIEIWAAGPKAAFSDLIRMLARELDADRAGLIDNVVGRGYRCILRPAHESVDEFIERRRREVTAADPVECLYLGEPREVLKMEKGAGREQRQGHYIFFGAFIREPPAPINGYI